MLFFEKNQINATIFDIDGTIIDSISLYYHHFNKGLKKMGYRTVSKEFLLNCLAQGVSLKDILKRSIPNDGEEVIEELASIILKSFVQVDINVPVLPGVREAFSFLKRFNTKIGLASGRTSGQTYEIKRLRHLGLHEYIDVVVTADEVERRKPHPDVILLCARKLGVKPESCLVIGDSISDIIAAHRAGAIAAAVCTGVDTRERLSEAKPAVIMDSLKYITTLLKESSDAS